MKMVMDIGNLILQYVKKIKNIIRQNVDIYSVENCNTNNDNNNDNGIN